MSNRKPLTTAMKNSLNSLRANGYLEGSRSTHRALEVRGLITISNFRWIHEVTRGNWRIVGYDQTETITEAGIAALEN